MEDLGLRLKVARTAAKLTQEEAVLKMRNKGIKITQSHLSRMEKGTRDVDVRQLKAFAQVYNCDILTLFFSPSELKQRINN